MCPRQQWITRQELRSLTDSATPVVTSRLQSGGQQSKIGEEQKQEVEQLKALLEKAQAALAEKEQQLAETKETHKKRQR